MAQSGISHLAGGVHRRSSQEHASRTILLLLLALGLGGCGDEQRDDKGLTDAGSSNAGESGNSNDTGNGPRGGRRDGADAGADSDAGTGNLGMSGSGGNSGALEGGTSGSPTSSGGRAIGGSGGRQTAGGGVSPSGGDTTGRGGRVGSGGEALGGSANSGGTMGSGGTTSGGTPDASGGLGTGGGSQSTGGTTGSGGDAPAGAPNLAGSSGTTTSAGGTAPTGGSSSGGAAGAVEDPYANDPLLAFPGARGFGAKVTGGRGGRVIKVTSLNANGEGSLQDALNQNEPRIIVFDVSGIIEADMIEVPYGDVTIAGQTAPGGGITINGRFFGAYDDSVGNIIVRHLRVRPVYDGSDGEQFDAIQFSLNHHYIFDHVSVSGGVDETFDMYSARDVTVQWSTIESSATSGHPEGMHNYGLINGPDGVRASILNNLFAHHEVRCPAIANGPAEIYNNVVYNVRHGFLHNNPASGPFNLVGNTYRTGSDDELFPFYFDDENDSAAADLSYYLDDNWLDGTNSPCQEGLLSNPWEQCEYDLYRPESLRSLSPHDFSGSGDVYVPADAASASVAYDEVLRMAGAFPRDAIARRSVSETIDRTGEWGARMPEDLMEGLTPTEAPSDSDSDGMADSWEEAHGLDPSDGDDHATVMDSGYTAIEEYVNELAARLVN